VLEAHTLLAGCKRTSLNVKPSKKSWRHKVVELQRRQELNRALAANMVGMGQSGLAGEGTPASIALAGAKQVGISEGAISLTEKLRQAQLRRQGSMAAQTGKLQAASTLLQAGADGSLDLAQKTKTPGIK
jgi:hypothetical protein